MSRRIALASLFAVAVMASRVSAQPADLLDQAIKESKSAKTPENNGEVKKLIEEGDRLAEQARWSDAIEAYGKAYRLSPGNSGNYRRLLLAKRAAGRLSTEERDALELIRQQDAIEVDRAFRAVQLDIIQARQAVKDGDASLAQSKHDHAQATLAALPRDIDVSVYTRQLASLKGSIQKRAKQESAKSEPAGEGARTENVGGHHKSAPNTAENAPALLSDGDPQSGEIVDSQSAMSDDQKRHAYDYSIQEALKKTRADYLISNNEAALPPSPYVNDMTFPADWHQKIARRARYRDGVIYETPPFKGQDGQTYITAIYDLGDLVHPVPNFMASYPGTARQQRTEELDRMYLRMRSQIFNGFPEDLAAGMPLLHYFGGINNNAISPRYDPREQDRIIRTIEQFIQGNQP